MLTVPKSVAFAVITVLSLGVGYTVRQSAANHAELLSAAQPPVVRTPDAATLSVGIDEPFVTIGTVNIPVEIATTIEAQEKGLSGLPSLDPERGMLFVFSVPDQYQFWMPDMRFPIDIIWIQNNRVVDIDEHVSNEFDPANPKFYTPSEPVQYVLEVNAGFAASHGINISDQVTLPLQE